MDGTCTVLKYSTLFCTGTRILKKSLTSLTVNPYLVGTSLRTEVQVRYVLVEKSGRPSIHPFGRTYVYKFIKRIDSREQNLMFMLIVIPFTDTTVVETKPPSSSSHPQLLTAGGAALPLKGSKRTAQTVSYFYFGYD